MLAYQVEGGSNSSGQEGWKHLNLDKATSLAIIDEVSEAPRNGYKGGLGGMVTVLAQVPMPPQAVHYAEAQVQAHAQANTSY